MKIGERVYKLPFKANVERTITDATGYPVCQTAEYNAEEFAAALNAQAEKDGEIEGLKGENKRLREALEAVRNSPDFDEHHYTIQDLVKGALNV